MNEVRRRAWETRRATYGPRGHSGSYRCWQTGPVGRYALDLVIRLHREAALSEGQCCKALNMDRVEFRRLVDEWPLSPAKNRTDDRSREAASASPATDTDHV